MSVLMFAEYALVGLLDILLVVLALDTLALSDAGASWLNAALGAGGLVGAVATLALIGLRRVTLALVAGAVTTGVSVAVTGLVDAVPSAVLLIAAAGAGKVFFDVAARTLVQRLLPDQLLTAMFGIQESLMMTGLAVGALAAPILVAQAGAPTAFAVAGCLLPATAVLVTPTLWPRDAAAEVPWDVYARLGAVPILAVLPPRILERLARAARSSELPSDTAVVREGKAGNVFYVVESGELAVTMGGVAVRQLGPGDWFGELALLRDSPRTATVTATTDVCLHTIDRDDFLTALARAPRSRAVAQEHADRHYR